MRIYHAHLLFWTDINERQYVNVYISCLFFLFVHTCYFRKKTDIKIISHSESLTQVSFIIVYVIPFNCFIIKIIYRDVVYYFSLKNVTIVHLYTLDKFKKLYFKGLEILFYWGGGGNMTKIKAFTKNLPTNQVTLLPLTPRANKAG